MFLYHDSEKASEIEELLVKSFKEDEEDRTDCVHLSDTGYCPIKVFCRLTGIKKLPFTREAIGKMTIGKVGQTIIQKLYPESCIEVEHPMMASHADVMEDGRIPIEIKFSAMRIFRAADVPHGWKVQLMGYMTLHKSNIGWLLIMNMFSGQWTAFKMEMTDQELNIHREFLQSFDDALTSKDISRIIPLVEIRYENDNERYADCKTCDYREGRNRNKLDLGPGCPFYRKPLST